MSFFNKPALQAALMSPELFEIESITCTSYQLQNVVGKDKQRLNKPILILIGFTHF